MTTLAERLRGVLGPGRGSQPLAGAEGDAGGGAAHDLPTGAGYALDSAAETLGGEWHDADGGRCLVVDRRYAPGHRHGRVAVVDALPPWPQLPLMGAPADGAERLLFLDLETTGLAGGAGTYAFLVGCGWFDGAGFRTRQFFLSSYTAERVLLAAVAAVAGDSTVVVTYNGKSFDLPLLDTRFILHRLASPFDRLPHVDMLHPARRLWRQDDEPGESSGCRLTALEETLCGHRREGDVPGFEIPSRYFHFVRTGDARPLAAVFEHNRLDLLALALVAAQAARLLDEGAPAARTAREALGLGRLYERAGRLVDARRCYDRAGELPAAASLQGEALRACAHLARRQRRYDDAAGAWRRILGLRRCPPALAREASEALAVHHEHRARDLREARRFAVQSLQFNAGASRERAARHRLARLDRKLGDPSAPLF